MMYGILASKADSTVLRYGVQIHGYNPAPAAIIAGDFFFKKLRCHAA